MAEGEHLLLAAGQGACELRFALGEFGEDRIDLGQLGGGFGAEEGACGAQVVVHRQGGQDAVAFGNGGDPGPADGFGGGFEGLAVERDGACADGQHAGEGEDEFGFASTVGADDGGDLAGLDGEGDACNEGAGAVGDGEVGDGDRHATSSVPR